MDNVAVTQIKGHIYMYCKMGSIPMSFVFTIICEHNCKALCIVVILFLTKKYKVFIVTRIRKKECKFDNS